MTSHNILYPHYFKTSEGIKIFFETNFKFEELNSNEPVILFNNGLGCTTDHYQYQVPYLHKRGFKVLLHHYRFHHNSTGTKNVTECTFDHIVSDISQLIEYLKIQKCILLGHSMGVNISLELASQNPSFILGMILISGTVLPPQSVLFDTNLSDVTTPLVQNLFKSWPKLINPLWKKQFRNPLIHLIILKNGFNPKRVSHEIVQSYLKKLGEINPEVFFQLMEEMRNHNILSRLERIKIPSLIMVGDKDKMIPTYIQKILHQHLSPSELYIVREGSHVPQIDFPQTVNERINVFLQNLYLNDSDNLIAN